MSGDKDQKELQDILEFFKMISELTKYKPSEEHINLVASKVQENLKSRRVNRHITDKIELTISLVEQNMQKPKGKKDVILMSVVLETLNSCLTVVKGT